LKANFESKFGVVLKANFESKFGVSFEGKKSQFLAQILKANSA
jgi:hypothetical protein